MLLLLLFGELGDKTFLASLGLGIQYPSYKLFLVAGAILGMVLSDFIAIILGKYLSSKISDKTMNLVSGLIFLIFGVLGIFSLIIT